MYRSTTLKLFLLFILLFYSKKDLRAQNDWGRDRAIPSSTVDTIKKYALTYPDETQFSVALIKNKVVSYLGIIKKDGILLPIDNWDSVFEIGSITKVFTSTVLINLIHDGTIDPDEAISKSLPFKLSESQKEGKIISYKMLSNHTSGIPSYPDSIEEYIKRNPENPFVDFDREKFIQYLSTGMKLNFAPGTQYDYSNLGAALLGDLIELKTGQPIDQLFQSMVFSKYDMGSTTMDRNKITGRLVKGHNETGKPVLNWDCNAIASAGACLSTARDLSKFVLANFSNDSILSYQRQRTYRVENNNLDLAYAWHIYRKNGIVWYFHNGGTGGYHSNVTMDLENKCAIVLLSNCTFEPKERYLENISWKILRTIE